LYKFVQVNSNVPEWSWIDPKEEPALPAKQLVKQTDNHEWLFCTFSQSFQANAEILSQIISRLISCMLLRINYQNLSEYLLICCIIL